MYIILTINLVELVVDLLTCHMLSHNFQNCTLTNLERTNQTCLYLDVLLFMTVHKKALDPSVIKYSHFMIQTVKISFNK